MNVHIPAIQEISGQIMKIISGVLGILPVNNEGTKGICSKIISGNRAPAMAVFDGMGGESCGEIAAFLASEEFGKFYNANKRMLRDMPEDFIDDVCEKMNQAVCRYGTEHHIWSMGKHNGNAPLYTRVYVCLQSWG